eukprot:TRINITY_DN3989_c0_g1_i2.p1 TRINITY_DN3989_c0_g1~~TRINITY_DN3989_c0_g1_i2.p1  ORF type:complete len:177 (+),score=26.15 TRINITY_DN3989_c0_g1_i2:51-533(+)
MGNCTTTPSTPPPSSPPYKIIITGEPNVGKTSLFHRYTLTLQLCDTTRQERFKSLTDKYYRNATGVLLVFDVTERTSFERVGIWLDDVRRYAHEGVGIVLVGNKVDREEDRVVLREEGEALASQLGVVYRETSAKDNVGVDEVFRLVAEMGTELGFMLEK